MENSTFTQPDEKCWNEHWLKRSWTLALHGKFKILYMQKFSSNFQDPRAIDEWCEVWAEALSGMEGEQIKAGLNYSRDHYEWPPTCAEFKAACKSKPKAVLSLPQSPRTDSETGKRNVADALANLTAKPINGREYWAKLLETEGLTPFTYAFAHKALHNLNNPGANL